MMQETSTTAHCDYIEHPNHVHELIYHTIGRDAVQEYFIHLERILRAASPNDIVYVLTNGTYVDGVQPINYMVARTRQLLSDLPVRPGIRLAGISSEVDYHPLMDGLFRMFLRGRDRLRFFPANRREEAIEWLLNG